jgi:hypothetical protein
MRFNRLFLISLLPALLVGCGDGVFEVRADAAYVLTRVNGEPLPATIVISQWGRRWLDADTLWFDGAGRFERVQWVSERLSGSDQITLRREQYAGVVRPVDGGVMLVADVCADPNSLALCVAPDTARLEGGVLVVRGEVPPAGVKVYAER